MGGSGRANPARRGPARAPPARRTCASADARLAGVDLIVHSADRRSVMYGVLLRLLHEAGVEPRVRHEVGETSTLLTLVAGAPGAAVLPEPVTALALEGVAYHPSCSRQPASSSPSRTAPAVTSPICGGPWS